MFNLVRNAHVSVRPERFRGHPIAVATINDQEHAFDRTSRVSKALASATPEQISARLTGGTFFFHGDDLIDFRDGNYNGFIHTDDGISRLIDTIGYETIDRKRARRTTSTSRNIRLANTWSNGEIVVPEYKEGGEFTSTLKFMWSPFSQNVNSELLIERLVCENGMLATSSILSTKIPLINRWEEHLDIASRQIQNKINGMVTARLAAMGKERATVDEALKVATHAYNRMSDNTTHMHTRERLRNIFHIVHPGFHLHDVYREKTFTEAALASQQPAHLTTFDLYNIATEIRSHSTENPKSSDFALDKIANHLVFDRKDMVGHLDRLSAPKMCSFADPDAAFYGEMH